MVQPLKLNHASMGSTEETIFKTDINSRTEVAARGGSRRMCRCPIAAVGLDPLRLRAAGLHLRELLCATLA